MKTSTVSRMGIAWPYAVLAIFAAQALPLHAQTARSSSGPEALYARSLAATCANCHGTDGRAVADSSVTSLAGLNKAFIVAQMTAFKNGTRPATVMHQLSKGYSDAQIESIAAYFAARKK